VVKTAFDLGLRDMTIKSNARPCSPRRHGGHGERQNLNVVPLRGGRAKPKACSPRRHGGHGEKRQGFAGYARRSKSKPIALTGYIKGSNKTTSGIYAKHAWF
jgi:hypothetical protein